MPELDQPQGQAAEPTGTASPDPLTLMAFVLAAIFAGGNAVAVKLGLLELAPFWGAAIRFLAASGILVAVIAIMDLPLPRGRALAGALVYGVLNFGLFYVCMYWALQEVTAATAMVTLSIVPLLTLILAVIQRVERFSYRGLAGSLLAALGIALIFGERIGAVSVLSLAALLGGALCAAQTGVVIKRYPRVHPVVENAIGMGTGGVLLLALCLLAGEPRVLPTSLPVQLSFVYLVLFGSIGLFLLFLYVLRRWTASATAYILLLAPLAAALLGLLILGEPVSLLLVVGGGLAIAGVYVGALSRPAPAAPSTPAKAPS